MTKQLKKIITLFSLLVVLAFSQKSFSQCFQIESILAAACSPAPNTEGYNEMARFRVGTTAINTSTLTVNFPAQSWQGLIQNATTATKVSDLNAAIDAAGGCGDLLEPIGGVLPANSTVILVTSYMMNTNSNPFGALAEDIYIIFQNNPSTTAGHFTNQGTNGNIMRTLTMNFGGGCSDSVTYNKTLLVDQNGANVDAPGATIIFTPSGTPTYVNYGCSAPIPPFTVDAGTPSTSPACPGTTVSLLGTAEGEQSVVWSASIGTFSDPTLVATNYTIPANATAQNITITLTATNSCGVAITDTTILTVSNSITPTFTLPSTLCTGATAPALPTTSNNGVTGTWSPATISNTADGSYVFTPTAGQCATTFTLNVTVSSSITPTFTLPTTLCTGATAPALPATSDNGITGTWSPATISNTANGSYVFTPTAGQCATTFTLNVTVSSNITPTFTLSNTYCNGATVQALPATSDNGITGTWSPATISNTANGSYVFTPTAGQCASTFTLNVTVSSSITPTFTLANTYCNGAAVPALPATSDNGITGTWSPATISNTANGSYVFTPTAGQCASQFTLTVTIQSSAPTVTGISYTTPVCADNGPLTPTTATGFTSGGTYFSNLPGLSINTATGEINVAGSTPGSYIVEYEVLATGCQSYGSSTAPVEIKAVVVPGVNFSYPATICKSSTSVMIIPGPGFTPGGTFTSDTGLSINPATGEVNPSLSTPNPHSVIYTFPADPANCVNPVPGTAIITFTAETTPAVSFSYPTPVCFNGPPVSPTTFPGTAGGSFSSDPGLSINPTTGQINAAASTPGPHTITYTVPQDTTICRAFGSDTFTLTIDAASVVAPITGGPSLCKGETLQLANATPGGTWSSSDDSVATVDSNGLVTGVSLNFVDIIYTLNSGCSPSTRITLAVYAVPQPLLEDRYLCVSNVTGLPFNSVNIECGVPNANHTFVWTLDGNPLPTTTNRHVATELGVYEVTVTNTISGCTNTTSCEVLESSTAEATATVGEDFSQNQTITVNVTSGSGEYLFQLDHGIPQESNVFPYAYQGEYTITVIDKNGCQDLEFTVFALNYPRFFTPNGDGYNDTWAIKGLTDVNAKTYIFDRFGKLVKFLNASGEEWDGTLNGNPLPSTDYWFLLEYKNRDGINKEFKAHFSMKR